MSREAHSRRPRTRHATLVAVPRAQTHRVAVPGGDGAAVGGCGRAWEAKASRSRRARKGEARGADAVLILSCVLLCFIQPWDKIR